jgi:hypothetical protein
MKKHTILFLAANPAGTSEHALGEEARAIQTELERCGYRDFFELATRWAAQPYDLLHELRKLTPTVVHFSGHRGERPIADDVGLCFQGPDGGPRVVSAQALQDTFGAVGSSVQVVVLSACHTDIQAEQLRSHVDCVVGMAGTIDDRAARTFAMGFYGGLGERASIADAFRQGCAAIRLDGLADCDRPQLKVRPGVDAEQLVLAPTTDYLVRHHIRVRELRRARPFLLPDRLAYVPPAPGHEAHPDEIARVLAEDGGPRGRVLIGSGGVGKTRLSLEVATHLAQDGWSVFHVATKSANNAAVTAGALHKEILAAVPRGDRVLLVFDYLDQMPQLDLGTLASVVSGLSEQRNIEVALLGTSRPLPPESLQQATELFTSIELHLDEHHAAIADAILDAAAPRATKLLGRTRAQDLCGDRPGIALFIAQQMEEIARTDPSPEQLQEIQSLRPASLTGWLRIRLGQDDLTRKRPEKRISAAGKEPELAAAAIALAATPQPRRSIVDAVERGLRAVNADPDDADGLVNRLHALGWLEEESGELVSPHDAVTDELLEQYLGISTGHTTDSRLVGYVLAAGLVRARTLNRIAWAFRRIAPRETASGPTQSHLQAARAAGFAADWLQTHVDELAHLLQRSDPEEAAYAMGALLFGVPFRDAANRQWERLFGAWLRDERNGRSVRHVLHAALRALPVKHAESAIDAAFYWLDMHRESLLATHVLGPLLSRDDVIGDQRARALGLAFAWLQLPRAAVAQDARYVLSVLLRARELDDTERERVLRFALGWLRAHSAAAASTLVATLIKRQDRLSELERREARGLARAWLRSHGPAYEASYVLEALLRNADDAAGDDGGEATSLSALAISWLALHPLASRSGHVLTALLEWSALDRAAAERTLEVALTWLRERRPSRASTAVLHAVLESRHLSAAERERVAALVYSRLDDGEPTLEGQYLLAGLLVASMKRHGSRLGNRIVRWLERYGRARDAAHLLTAALDFHHLGAAKARITSAALGWLETRCTPREAAPLLTALLELEDLEPEDQMTALVRARMWLNANVLSSDRFLDASFVLSGVLSYEGWSERAAVKLRCQALQWLDRHMPSHKCTYVLAPLLRSAVGSAADLQQATSHCERWLDVHGTGPGAAPLVMAALEFSYGLAHSDVVPRALLWLGEHGRGEAAIPVLVQLVLRGDLTVEQRGTVVGAIDDWLSHHALHTDLVPRFHKSFRISCHQLLVRKDLTEPRRRAVMAVATAWLERPDSTSALIRQFHESFRERCEDLLEGLGKLLRSERWAKLEFLARVAQVSMLGDVEAATLVVRLLLLLPELEAGEAQIVLGVADQLMSEPELPVVVAIKLAAQATRRELDALHTRLTGAIASESSHIVALTDRISPSSHASKIATLRELVANSPAELDADRIAAGVGVITEVVSHHPATAIESFSLVATLAAKARDSALPPVLRLLDLVLQQRGETEDAWEELARVMPRVERSGGARHWTTIRASAATAGLMRVWRFLTLAISSKASRALAQLDAWASSSEPADDDALAATLSSIRVERIDHLGYAIVPLLILCSQRPVDARGPLLAHIVEILNSGRVTTQNRPSIAHLLQHSVERGRVRAWESFRRGLVEAGPPSIARFLERASELIAMEHLARVVEARQVTDADLAGLFQELEQAWLSAASSRAVVAELLLVASYQGGGKLEPIVCAYVAERLGQPAIDRADLWRIRDLLEQRMPRDPSTWNAFVSRQLAGPASERAASSDGVRKFHELLRRALRPGLPRTIVVDR